MANTHDKVVNSTSHQKNANKSCTDILVHTNYRKVILKRSDDKCWQRCEQKETACPLEGCKLDQPLWKN